MFSMPSGIEWLVVLIVALLIFGNRLPGVMRSLGRSISEFKKGMREDVDETPGSSSGEEIEKSESRKELPK